MPILPLDQDAFVDMGIGVKLHGGKPGGVVLVTTSTPAKRDHLCKRVSLPPPVEDDDYQTNRGAERTQRVLGGDSLEEADRVLPRFGG